MTDRMMHSLRQEPPEKRDKGRRRPLQTLVPGVVAVIVLVLAGLSLAPIARHGIGTRTANGAGTRTAASTAGVRVSSQPRTRPARQARIQPPVQHSRPKPKHASQHQTVAHVAPSKTGGSMPQSGTASPQSATAAPQAATMPLNLTQSAVIGDSDHYKITIYDLRRNGPYLTADFGIVCEKAGSNGCQTKVDFDGSNFANANVFDTVAGVELVDPVQQKEYQEVQDSKNEVFCSSLPSSIPVGPTTHLAWANFAAPPASVTSLDVAFWNGGPQFSAVPITRGPAQDPSGSQVVNAGLSHFDLPAGSTTTGLKLPVLDLVDKVGSGGSWNLTQKGGQVTMNLSSDVMFDFGSSDLSPAAQSVLTTVASKLKSGGHGVVTVTGYTDSIGPASVNMPLSVARAQAVVTALKPLVASVPVTFQATGKGSADPIAPNTNPDGSDNPAGRAQNRRVTLSFSVSSTTALTSTTAASPAPASMPATNSADYVAKASAVHQMDHYHVTVNSLAHEGNLAVLHLTVTCTSATSDSGSAAAKTCEGASDLSGTNTIPPQTNSPSTDLNATTGIYLTDPTGKQIYAPVRDADAAPLVTMTDPGWPVGNTYAFWLYFPAPSNASSVTVQLPGGAAHISGVPVTTAQG